MKCEACGGDGQIEYGAYRGDESGPTRECKLCGGVITTNPTIADIAGSVGVSAQSGSVGLQRLAQVTQATTETDGLLVSVTTVNGIKVREDVFARPAHRHQWSFHVVGHAVSFECVNDCGAKMLFSEYGSLIEGKPVESAEMQYLSRRATMIYESHINSLKTAKQTADERQEQLRQENERQQRAAEEHEHVWDSGTVGMPYGGDLTDRRIDIRCVLCKELLIFNTGGGLVQGEVEEPQLSDLAQRARIAALLDKSQRRERGML